MKKKYLILLFIFISFLAYSQENTVRMLILFEKGNNSEFSDSEILLMYETLIVKLDNDINNLNIIESDQETLPLTDDQKTALAENLNTISWLNIVIYGDSGDLDVEIRLYDLKSQTFLIDEKIRNKAIESYREFSRQFWNDIVTMIDDSYIKISETVQEINLENARTGEIIVKALTGTKIKGLGEEDLVVGPQGELIYETIIPSSYSIEASLRGYYPYETDVFTDMETKTVIIKQEPKRRLFFDIYMNNFSFFGSDISVFIVPDYFYIKSGFTTHIFGFSFNSGTDSIFVSYPLTYFYTGIGAYLNPNHHKVRANLAAVFFTRISHSKEYGFNVDKLFPFGIQPIIGIEFFPDRKVCAFLEYAPYIYFSNASDLMNSAYPDDYDFKTYIVTDKMLIEFMNYRVGVRIRL
jgi:hypothetical protein